MPLQLDAQSNPQSICFRGGMNKDFFLKNTINRCMICFTDII
jgi:hypothetical protein